MSIACDCKLGVPDSVLPSKNNDRKIYICKCDRTIRLRYKQYRGYDAKLYGMIVRESYYTLKDDGSMVFSGD